MAKERKAFRIGRDAETGRLKPVEDAKKDPKGSVVENMPLPGFGDSGRYDDKKKKK